MKKGIVWLTVVLTGLLMVSCSRTNDDFNRVLKQEQDLVAYLQTNFPAYQQISYQGIGSTQYYVPLLEGTGDYPVFDQDYITISYRTWKMDNYSTWAPNNADLLNTSDSAESVQRVVIRNYIHGGPELYPISATFPEFGLALSKMKKGGKIRLYIAPSISSGIKDYTRVMELSLVDIVSASDFDTVQHQMMETYRAGLGIPEEDVQSKHLITTSSSAITIGSVEGDSYLVLDPYAGEGYVPYWIEQAGTGDVISDASVINITSLSYGYLQKGRHVSNSSIMDYISIGHNLSFPAYIVGKGFEIFGDGLDELLIGQRKGVHMHIFTLSKFAFGWTGKVSDPAEGAGSDAYSSFLIPPGVPVVFNVTVGL